LTDTVRVVPVPVTVVIAAVPRLAPAREKLLAAPPVTLSLKVTRKLTVVPDGGFAPTRVIETTRGEIEYPSPCVKGSRPSAFPEPSASPVELTTLSPSVPVAVPTLAVTVRVVPLPVTLAIEAPEDPLPVSSKLPDAPPVIALLKVTVQLTVEAIVGLAATRWIETTLGGSMNDSPVV